MLKLKKINYLRILPLQGIECASVCLRDKTNCLIYGISGSDCYLGSPARSENVISGPASQDLKMFMSKGKFQSLVWMGSTLLLLCTSDYIDTNLTLPFTTVSSVETPSWSRFLYKSVAIRENYGFEAAITCSILDPAESLACEILFTDGTDCYFGNSSTNSTNYSFSMSQPLNIAMKSGICLDYSFRN